MVGGNRDRANRVVVSAIATAVAATLLVSAGPFAAADEAMVEVEDGCTGNVVRIPASELGPPPAAATPEAGEPPPDGTARPDVPPSHWLAGRTQCRRYRTRRYCDGPLRVPEPYGPENDLARRLGLGSHTAGGRALEGTPPPAWLEAVRGLRAPSRLKWPVDGGSVLRGLKRGSKIRVRVPPRRRGGRARVTYRVKPPHRGVDIGASPGTHVFAIEDGLVIYSKNEMRGYGNVVLVLHSDESISLYAHLRAAWVFPGQIVRRGQVLGEVGETGLARGPHLHFEWRLHGRPLDPLPHFVERPRGRRPDRETAAIEASAAAAEPEAEPTLPEAPEGETPAAEDEETAEDADFDL